MYSISAASEIGSDNTINICTVILHNMICWREVYMIKIISFTSMICWDTQDAVVQKKKERKRLQQLARLSADCKKKASLHSILGERR